MENLSFMDWSNWFEMSLCPGGDPKGGNADAWREFSSLAPDVIALMGWIMSASDSAGSAFNAYEPEFIAREIGSDRETVQNCFEALAKVGMIDLRDDSQSGHPEIRVALPIGDEPPDADQYTRLIASFPWRKGE